MTSSQGCLTLVFIKFDVLPPYFDDFIRFKNKSKTNNIFPNAFSPRS